VPVDHRAVDLVAVALRASGLARERRPVGQVVGSLAVGSPVGEPGAPTAPTSPTHASPIRPAPRPVVADVVAVALQSAGFTTTGDATSRPGDRPDPVALPHRRALDGLRGVAIALVVAFHLGVSWARGGFVGVDVFFVLSGYLITGLLLVERHQSQRIDLPRFWGRRARRLLPALCLLLVVLAVVAAVDPRLVSPTALRVDGLATLFYFQTWHLALQSTRAQLAQIFAPSPLLQTWSLAIEEQFYVLWPLVLGVVAVASSRRAHRFRQRLAVVIVAGVLCSVALMAFLSANGSAPLAIYYDSGTRAFELLIGAGLALALPLAPSRGEPAVATTGTVPAAGPAHLRARRRARQRRMTAALAGTIGLGAVLAIAVAAPGINATWLYRGGLLGVALAAALVIGAVARHPGTPVARLLSWAPLVGLGRISYGIYLWHWPVLVLVTTATTGLRGWPLPVLQLTLTLGAALVSWVVVEQPLPHLAPRRAVRQLAAPVVAAGGACLLVGVLAVPTATTPSVQPTMATPSGQPTAAGPPVQPTVAIPPSTGMIAPVR